MFAVMTRLEEPKRQNVDIVKKMKLYDGEDVEGYKSKDVRELKEETIREGMDGSRRATSSIVSRARWSATVSPVSIPSTLRAIKDGFEQHTGISSEQRERYLNHISQAARSTTNSRRSKCSARLSTRLKRWPARCATTISITSRRSATRKDQGSDYRRRDGSG